MRNIAVFGAGGFGRVVMPILRQQLVGALDFCNLTFVDDSPTDSLCNGYPVLGYAEWINRPGSSRNVAVAISHGRSRRDVVERLENDGINFLQVRAMNVIELDNVSINEGAILCPFVTLTSNVEIGRHFHANVYSCVEHDCRIGDYVTFAPGVKCNGNVIVEDYVYVGAGAIIKNGTKEHPIVIGRGAVIGMGSVVTRSVPAGKTVVGNPARVI